MSAPGVFVPGLFSQAGRETAFEIENLQNQLKLHSAEDGGDKTPDGDDRKKKKAPKISNLKERILKLQGASAAKNAEDVKPRTVGGELALAIQAKLRKADESRQQADREQTRVDITASKSKAAPRDDGVSIPFNREGKNGNYATKFTATYDVGSINHRGEQRPPVCWYQARHESVLDRPPAWDFHMRPQHSPRTKPEKVIEHPLAFMTGIDVSDADAFSSLTSRQRALMKDAMGLGKEKPEQKGTMSLNSERGPLGKIGRTHVLANEISCAYDGDLLEQDIKGYPKLRYPKWDFEACEARKPLIPTDALGEPGKYDVNLDCVRPVPKEGIGFGKALPRSVCVSTMGYSAPPAVLHPEDKRTRGLLPDRSTAKNAVRHRAIHVNDFDREMARPPLLTGAATVYHDENDPAACEAIHRRDMTYDATTADIGVTHRRDIAPKYRTMIGRGRDAVQGVRAISSDLAVRGSVGLGFVETKSMAEHSVAQVESRASRGGRENPDIGPDFQFRTVNVHNSVTERMLRGRPLVKGSGLDTKHAPLNKKDNPILSNAFKRSPSLPGYDSRSKLGGTRVLPKSRSSSAIAGWSPAELGE